MQQDSNVSRRELEARLMEKASKDSAFRRALLEDPKGTLEGELRVQLPEGVSLAVLEETPTARYLVLPPAPAGTAGELSDAELEAAAGGGGYTWSVECFQAGLCPGNPTFEYSVQGGILVGTPVC